MSKRTLLPASLLLAVALACGGGASSSSTSAPPPKATSLAYADPGGSGWRLVKDPASTPTRLVLDLVGPAGLRTRGVGFNLQAPAGVRFSAFANQLPIEDTGVYQLLSAAADPNEPVALTGGVRKGNVLSVGIYQKDRAMDAKDSGAPLCRIALALDAAGEVPAGADLALQVLKAKAIPEDIGATTDDAWTLSQKLRMADLSVAVGSLSAR